MIASQAPARIDDPASDPRYLPQVDELTGLETRSALTVPLVARGESLGAIQLVNRRSGDGTFDEQDQVFLEALADDASAALKNASLFEAEKRARDLRALLDFTHEITATLDMDRVLLSIVNLAGRAIPFRRCVLAVWEKEALIVRAVSGEERVDRTSSAVKEIERFLGWTSELDEEFYVRDTGSPEDESAAALREKFPRYVEESAAGCIKIERIRDGEGPLGVLLFEFDEAESLDEWSLEAADLVAHESALALRNAQLYADVPFIGLLGTVADRRRQLRSLPRATWIRWGAAAAVIVLALTLVRFPLRVTASEARVRSVVQRPARAAWDGIVAHVNVAEGDRVAAGQSLAVLRNDPLDLEIRQAQAELEMASREVIAAEARGDGGSGTLARAREAEAREVLSVLEGLKGQSVVESPADGIVLTSRMHERVGLRLGAGEVLAWVGDPGWIELEMEVRQRDVSLVAVEDPVRVRVSTRPDLTFEGHVVAIAPVVRESGREPLATVRAVLDNRAGNLLPGMEARARIYTDARALGVHLFRAPWRWVRMRIWW